VFIEDTALVLDEVAVITRPGAESRRGETAAVAAALAAYRALSFIEPPGTLDGGDILRLGKSLYVGVSGRSNTAGIHQLGSLLGSLGYTVQGVPLNDCLHLKSAVTQVAGDTLLVNPRWVDPAVFGAWRLVEVDPQEPYAANALLLGEAVVYPAAYTRTAARLEQLGLSLHRVDASELAKAEGGVTCCSLIL
jgi:dimethylargininase